MENIKMIAIDLGKTLLTDNNVVTTENINAINFAHSKGILVVMATARMYSSTKYISKIIKADYGVFGNGSQLMDLSTKNILFQKVIKKDDANLMIDYARKNHLYIHIDLEFEEVSEEYDFFTKKHMKLNEQYPESLKSNVKLVNDIKEYVKNKNIIKIIIASEESLDAHIEQIKELTNARLCLNEHSKNLFEEIIGKRYNYAEFGGSLTTKATGIHYLATKLKIQKSQIMAIGDLDNDVELFETIGIPVVMKNAKPEIKVYATYITTKDNNNSGVAEAIYKMIGEG